MTSRTRPRFSVTCRTDEEPIARCLKALADYVERRRIDGRAAGALLECTDDSVTLKFTHPDHRAAFITLATELLEGRWTLCSEQDDDRGRPQPV